MSYRPTAAECPVCHRTIRIDHPDLADELELSTGVAANLLAEAAVHYYELKALRMEIANALAGTI
jgi:hypothetical protein